MHAVIEVSSATDISLIDLGSESGTTINGERVNKKKIGPGDRIVFGGATVCLESVDGVEALAARPAPATSLRASREDVEDLALVPIEELEQGAVQEGWVRASLRRREQGYDVVCEGRSLALAPEVASDLKAAVLTRVHGRTWAFVRMQEEPARETAYRASKMTRALICTSLRVVPWYRTRIGLRWASAVLPWIVVPAVVIGPCVACERLHAKEERERLEGERPAWIVKAIWTGAVQKAEGIHIETGTPCQVEGYFKKLVNGDASSSVLVRCGSLTLAEGYRACTYPRSETPDGLRFALACPKSQPDSDSPTLTIDTAGSAPQVVVERGLPATPFRVEVTAPQWSDPTEPERLPRARQK